MDDNIHNLWNVKKLKLPIPVNIFEILRSEDDSSSNIII
jgi:hypothetical protein